MSVEAWNPTPEYTISGTGPYAITHPYAEGAIRAAIRLDTGLLVLNTGYSVSPLSSDIQGNLTLSPTVATEHAGRKLIIDRVTPDEQGWLAVLGEREAGLAAQLDRMVQATQETRAGLAGALKIRGVLDAFDWPDGTVPLRDGSRVIGGPTAAQIAAAQDRATEAAASAAAAAASAAEALARELSMFRDRGVWANGVFYSPSDHYDYDGEWYIVQTPHFATTVNDDVTAGRVRKIVRRGAPGAGTGDVLVANAGSEYSAVQATFRANIGLGALAIKSLAAFADLDPAAIITAVETLAANKTVENALPTAKAVADYVDALLQSDDSGALATTSGTTSDYNLIPAGVKRVKTHFNGVSQSGTNQMLLRIGPSGGVETAGYIGAGELSGGESGNATGFLIRMDANARKLYGTGTLARIPGTNSWTWSFTGATETGGIMSSAKSGGFKTITGDLARIQLRPDGGNAFDAGSVVHEWFYY